MKLWVGLGNPGAKYAGNRHNIGFMALDHVAADHGFSGWRRGFQGLVAEGRLGGERVLLLKPETFMNLSGQSVGEAARFHKLTPADVTVFHDELDLAPGKIKVKTAGGHAGHNGLRSIHAHIGEAYHRVRLGIGHPGHKDAVAGYVLHDFGKADQGWLTDLLRGISEGAPMLADGDGARFLTVVARHTAPPRPSTGTAPTKTAPAKTAPAKTAPAKTAPEREGTKRAPDPAAPLAGSGAPRAATAAPEPEDSRSPLQKLADRFRRSEP